jgi:chorismate synthase
MDEIVIRECVTINELDQCVRLQREVFGLPELEVSPRRHLVVTLQAGGWTLGAFTAYKNERLIGFVHHLVAIRGDDEIIGYSHMMAVQKDYQNRGVGGKLKWAQRARALKEGRRFIKWTWDPMQARNAHFNLNGLGVTACSYAQNFYGTDYFTDPEQKILGPSGIDSDRLLAAWDLQSPAVLQLANGHRSGPTPRAARKIEIPPDWTALLQRDVNEARAEQLRVRAEFQQAFGAGLVCAAFDRETRPPAYLLYEFQNL